MHFALPHNFTLFFRSTTMLHLHEFSDFTQLSQQLAQQWLDVIMQAEPDKTCSFALAGGTTPAPLYQQFDQQFDQRFDQPVAQEKNPRIQLVATDERWVVDEDAASNEGLIKTNFQHSQKHWDLISLKVKQETGLAPITDSIAEIEARLKSKLPHAFSAVILGMGEDQHVASLFPDRQPSLDPQLHCLEAIHPSTGQQRVSLSLMRLLNTERMWIVIKGAEKRKIIEQVQLQCANNSNQLASPIAYILGLAKCDVDVFWCP
jgi:6-phosphogluconolactonase